MARVPWRGAGLSSGPGIRRAARLFPLTLWNRTVKKAEEALDGVMISDVEVRALEVQALSKQLRPGDIVVSMLPAPMHPEFAGLCLETGAHFVSTSYISDAMRKLDAPARAKGLSFINEAGLDPGLDHLLAHQIVAEFRDAPIQKAGASRSTRMISDTNSVGPRRESCARLRIRRASFVTAPKEFSRIRGKTWSLEPSEARPSRSTRIAIRCRT
jgi:hypothetical protein